MGILTKPKFYYIEAVGLNSRFISFDEGLGEIVAELNPSSYSIEELMLEAQRAVNLVATQAYTFDFDRINRTVTISASSNFDLLVTTGSNFGLDAFGLLGFTSDQTGSNSYTGAVIGSEYIPQFPLQDFESFDDNEESVQASINESASGIVEVVSFGRRRFMNLNIRYIKNGQPCSDSIYGNDPNAITNIRNFLSFCIGKGRLEFMIDQENENVFDKVLLESTPESKDGVSYRLKEMNGLQGFFETGKLKFRRVN